MASIWCIQRNVDWLVQKFNWREGEDDLTERRPLSAEDIPADVIDEEGTLGSGAGKCRSPLRHLGHGKL